METFNSKSVLITGGTGSLGRALVHYLLEKTQVRRVAIYSRDELKQSNMKSEFQDESRLRWFLGDIRDKDRLVRAMHGVDYVVHAAALKQVDTGEYNPMEFIKTNVLGSQNVIEASIDARVSKVLALSTDKASSPINLYGATKLTADKLFVAANNYSQSYGTKFAVVRYGNVMGSRGSVIPFFRNLARQNKPLPITDKRMTRFWISLEDAVKFVLDSFEYMQGGELYVPRIPSMRILDLANAISPNSELIEIGIRPGEKLHEEMISAEDSRRTLKIAADRFLVLPVVAEWEFIVPTGESMEERKAYASDSNDFWMDSAKIAKFMESLK
jgi:UDP-N-acetylglucosamine 4,6-dehydratase